MAATLALSIDTGEISVNMDDAEVTIDDFYLEIDYSLGIEHLLQDEIEEMIIEALEAEITDSVAPMIQESLEQLDLSYETEALGANLAVAASISELLVEEDGIEMAFDVEISIDAEETTEHPFEGCFTRPRAPDDISRTGDFALYVSDDLMNRLLFTIWQAARLSDELSTLEGTLSPIFVGIVGATEGTLEIDALLPPVIVQSGDGFEFQIGEINLDLTTPDAPLGENLRMVVDMHIPITPVIEEGMLRLQVGEILAGVDASDEDWLIRPEEIGSILISSLPLEMVTDLVNELEIYVPVYQGVRIINAELARGTDGASTMLSFDIQQQETE
jgi:hypothetical protein